MLRALLSRSSEDRSVSLVGLEEEDTISINVEAVYAFLPAPPRMPWREVAGVCGSALAPMYKAVQATVQSEFDNMAHFFAELDFLESASMERAPSQVASFVKSEFPDVKSVPSIGDEPLVVRNANPAIPTIVITPCDPEPRQSSCWVPLQDACFGQRLVVPSYPVANDVYPPLLAKPLPLARRWEYANGHWRAVLPTVDEQVRRGWFSRVIAVRRRPRHWR